MSGILAWRLRDGADRWSEVAAGGQDTTPYHLAEYLLAEEKAEDGETWCFALEDGRAALPMVVRPISEGICDLITPHEYGGIIGAGSAEEKRQLLDGAEEWAREHGAVTEFARLNPYIEGLPDVYRAAGWEVSLSCGQVSIDLRRGREELVAELEAHVRRNLKRAEKEGLRFEVAKKCAENVRAFERLYCKAMDILGAVRFLYFNPRYFDAVAACDCASLCMVRDADGNMVSGAIVLSNGKKAYYHLGCFDRQATLKRPMDCLIHSMIMHCKEAGYETLHLGGGGESLLHFKTGFSSGRVQYYTARRVCNEAAYKRLCDEWRERHEKFFPMYRAGVI